MVFLSRMFVVFLVLTSPTSMKANPHCMAAWYTITSKGYERRYQVQWVGKRGSRRTERDGREWDEVEIVHIVLQSLESVLHATELLYHIIRAWRIDAAADGVQRNRGHDNGSLADSGARWILRSLLAARALEWNDILIIHAPPSGHDYLIKRASLINYLTTTRLMTY